MRGTDKEEMDRFRLEDNEDWREISRKIPAIRFPSEWNVKVIPPFAGAVARFTAEHEGCEISVYLDWYDRLGIMSNPYWEIYPNAEGDTSRFWLDETDELIDAIHDAMEAGQGISK